MALPKRKNNIQVYTNKELTGRREELLNKITKNDVFLPDSILHDDLDVGFLDFVKQNFKVVSDGNEIPIISKILTVQRWSEISENWNFSDEDGNMKLPFIAIVRKPDVQPGTNPIVQRTIPDRRQFYYSSVKRWDGNQMTADVYKIPQPVAVDISYEMIIVCQKFRDLNRLNKTVLQKFSSRQAYTTIKGHYLPIILDRITDNSSLSTVDNRKFYLQTYDMTMLGYLIDSDEFEVKPAINRFFLLNEFIAGKNYEKKFVNKTIDTTTVSFKGDGQQKIFNVGENIGFLFFVSVNGLIQQKDVDYYHLALTPRISFIEAPYDESDVVICYYAGRTNTFIDAYGKPLFLETESFEYNGGSYVFTTKNQINSIIHLEINGIVDEEGVNYNITGNHEVTLTSQPTIGSRITITYIY